MTTSSIQICSLDDLEIQLSPDVKEFLVDQYHGDDILERVLCSMKRPPASTICRVNKIMATREQVKTELLRFLQPFPHIKVEEHHSLDDILCLVPNEPKTVDQMNYGLSKPIFTEEIMFADSASRREKGWPMTHRVIMCDRYCAEAVLRGSDIFVRGILAADSGISKGDIVAVYADIRESTITAVAKGLVLDQSQYDGRCVYLGLGTVACQRSEFFRASYGIGIHMSQDPTHRVGPCLPPLSGILEGKMMLQNLPSVFVGHVLNPQPNETILDMCAAPGGKSAHLASLVDNRATIVSCDKGRKKMVLAKELFQRLGATCITPLSFDSTKCVEDTSKSSSDAPKTSIKEILANAPTSEKYGLKIISHFPPESFDRILLDPPCSALGLRPKLFVEQTTIHQLQKHAQYQKNFITQAVALLKPGGYMTYSTCTISKLENEEMVRHILDNYPMMELLPIEGICGQAGLPGAGLSDSERGKVRRFDPHDEHSDTMGFFLALFRKKQLQEGWKS